MMYLTGMRNLLQASLEEWRAIEGEESAKAENHDHLAAMEDSGDYDLSDYTHDARLDAQDEECEDRIAEEGGYSSDGDRGAGGGEGALESRTSGESGWGARIGP
jgi:hypothetical protein